MKQPPKSCLYLTYDGLLDPLGRSQILPYLERFAAKGIFLTVVSFEKMGSPSWREGQSRYRQRLGRQRIHWVPLRYHKWPPLFSTLFDLLQGGVVCTWLCWRKRPEIVHARSYVASLLALWVKRLTQAKFLFDMRGFWPEERVEGGLSRPQGLLYRCIKWWEARFFRAANTIVVLSHAAKEHLESRMENKSSSAPVVVIPTCADLKKFAPSETSNGAGLARIVYVGSVGTWYLIKETVQFFQALQQKRPEARLTILTPRPDPLLGRILKDLACQAVDVRMLTYEEVPEALKTMHASLCFIKPVDSKKASCPTKVGESLASGVPVVITKDIGDCDRLIEKERVGIVVSDLSQEGYNEAAARLIALVQEGKALRERCRRVAEDHFDLAQGVARYLSLYEELFAAKNHAVVTGSGKGG